MLNTSFHPQCPHCMDGRKTAFRPALGDTLLLLLCLLLFPATASARQVRDCFGRPVTVPDQVKRIVVLSRDMLELLRAMDAMPLVVGVSDTLLRDPEFWPELHGIPMVGHWSAPSYEAVAKLHPDLLLAYGRYPGPEAEAKLSAAGIPILRLEVYMLSGFDQAARTLGAVVGRQAAMEKLLAWRHEKFARLAACRRQAKTTPLVFLEGFHEQQAWGPGTSGNESLGAAGGRNLAANLPTSYGEVSPEWVLAGQPDAIIKVTSSQKRYQATDDRSLRDGVRTIRNRPGYDALKAVRQDKVFILASDIHGGPRAPIGAGYEARWLHPGQCPDIDPAAWNREYMERFQHMPDKGFFAWPKPGEEARP